MKKARVTAEEKRVRAVDFLMEQKTLFNLKELESQLPKQKGIVSQAVKELIEELVVENQVEKDKIGAGNYFWCFPSKALTVKTNTLAKLDQDIVRAHVDIEELTIRKRKLQDERVDGPDRKAMLSTLASLRHREKILDEELASLAANDPAKLRELVTATEACRLAANRWGDNIHQLVRFYKNRLAEFNYAQFMKHFGLDEDLDDILQFKD